jgi:hypothetical protein
MDSHFVVLPADYDALLLAGHEAQVQAAKLAANRVETELRQQHEQVSRGRPGVQAWIKTEA